LLTAVERIELGVAALAQLGADQAQLQELHRERLADDRHREAEHASGERRVDRVRVVEQRAGVGEQEEHDQRPCQAGREEPADEERGEQQNRQQVARGAASGPEGQRDDRHHQPGHDRPQRQRHGPAPQAREHRPGAPCDREQAQPDDQLDVRGAGAGEPLHDQAERARREPHQPGSEIGQRPVVVRVSVPVQRAIEGRAQARHRFDKDR
jgi:hypothetical protein